MSKKNVGQTNIDVGDQTTSPHRPIIERGPLGVDDVEDTEGHVWRTYPGATPDEPPECRSPLPGDEEDRLGRI
jgi:hypothetical protein